MMRRCILLAGITVSLAYHTVSAGERFALVVAAWRYPYLAKDLELRGPPNDAAALVELLGNRGFTAGNTVVLVDGHPQSRGSPTRKAILNALDEMAARVKPEDYVMLYFAGHGSQQPVTSTAAVSPDEDGWDEIFLPADVKGWNKQLGAVQNAIVDDEFKQKIEPIRRKGAFVWAVFDTCHAATMTRGPPSAGTRDRTVTPKELGIPGQSLRARRRAGVAPWVAFYAAQSGESTPEMGLPEGLPGARVMGLFSFTLLQAMAQSSSVTYRQIGEQVLSRYRAYFRSSTPMFEGDGLDRLVFDQASETAWVRQWPVETANHSEKGAPATSVKAGLLHGLRPGSLLALMPSALARTEEATGYLEVTTAGLYQSTVRGVTWRGKPALTATKIARGSYARLISSPAETFKVALLPDKDARTEAGKLVQTAIDNLRRRDEKTINVEWVKDGAPADLRLATRIGRPGGRWEATNRLWFFPSTGFASNDSTENLPTLPLEGKDISIVTHELEDALRKIGKVARLTKLAAQMTTGLGKDIDLAITAKRATGSSVSERLSSTGDSTFYDGDRLRVSIGNQRSQAIDVTLLLIDSRYGIQPVFLREPGLSNRVEKKTRVFVDATVRTDTTGAEKLLVIAIPVDPDDQQDSQDFSFLAQTALPATKDRSHLTPVESLLIDTAFSNRGDQRDVADAGLALYSWKVAPRADAGRSR